MIYYFFLKYQRTMIMKPATPLLRLPDVTPKKETTSYVKTRTMMRRESHYLFKAFK